MRNKYGQILDVLKGANISIAGLGLMIFTMALAAASVRLKIIVGAQGNDASVTFFEAVSLTFIGYFFNNFLPTAIGGDVVKAYYLSKKTSYKTASYTSIFLDRAVGLITMVFMAFIALLFVDSRILDRNMKLLIYAVTILSALGIFFMFNKNFARKFSGLLVFVRPVEDKVRNIYNAVHRYKHHPMLILQSFAISVFSQLLFFASIAILAASISSHIPIRQILLKMPIISLISLLPSINGLGVREGSTVVFFGPLIGKANAFAVSILWLAMLAIVSITGGVIYGLSPQFKIKRSEMAL